MPEHARPKAQRLARPKAQRRERLLLWASGGATFKLLWPPVAPKSEAAFGCEGEHVEHAALEGARRGGATPRLF